jgi:archaellum component FlaC
MTPNNGSSRLDRIEENLEKLVGIVERLADHVHLVDESLAHLAQSQLKLAEAQNQTEERLNALIAVVDDIVRRRPPA